MTSGQIPLILHQAPLQTVQEELSAKYKNSGRGIISWHSDPQLQVHMESLKQ